MTGRRPTLKRRITVIALLAMAVLGAGIYLVGEERVAISSSAYRQEISHHLRRHWHNTLQVISAKLNDIADPLLEDPAVLSAVVQQDRAALARRIAALLPEVERHMPLGVLQVAGSDSTLLFSRGVPESQALVDGWAAANVLRFGTPLQGLQRLSDGRYVVLFGLPLLREDARAQADTRTGGGQPAVVGTATFGIALDESLRLLRRLMGHDVILTAAGSGRPISDAQDPALWQRLLPQLATEMSGARTIDADGRSYDVVSFAVPRPDGHAAAWMHLVRDVTVQELRRALLDWGTLLGSLALGVLTVSLLYAYLRRAFLPLDEAVTVLDRLARGDTSLGLATGRRDEIGRIAGAIEVFRARSMEVRRFDKGLRRQQRRQQAFIRRQMETLAATLEAEARQAVLADLARLESRDPEQREESDGLARELGLLAVAFRQMSQRVRDQHVRLEHLVRELRDALEHKTRLIALEQELEIARNIQRSILPADLPPTGGFEFAGAMIPAREVGGDFYDFFPLAGDRVGVLVADVSGKGVPAAFFMLIARTLVRATALFGMPPGRCLARVNDLLAAENEEMMFVTLFYGIVDLRHGTLRYANGGHNPPLLRRAQGGAVEALPPTGGIALAVVPGQDYAEAEVGFAPGDLLLMFSDGVTEAFAGDGGIFGEARLRRVLAELASPSPTAIAAILAAVERFAAGTEQSDDITAVAVRRLAEGEPPG